MRLTHIHARDFLSFAELELNGLDPQLNVIVGPNGAGKSNVVRTVHLATLALIWASSMEPGERVREYARAVRQGARSEEFCVRIGVELDQEHERDLLVTWLRTALLSTFVSTNQSRAASTDAYLLTKIERQTVDSLCRGSVVVAFQRLPAERFFVGYEFDVDGQTYCYVMRGDRHGGIVRGCLNEQAPRSGGPTRSSDRLLVGKDIGNSREIDIPFDFQFERLLPDEGEFIPLSVQPLHNSQETDTVREFMRMFGFGVENRVYMLDVVFARFFIEVMIVNECRGVASHRYRAEELTVRAEPGRAGQVPLELLRLKLGGLEERGRFQRTQELFRELTGVNFDLHLQRMPGIEAADDFEFEIDIDIVDGSTAVPLAFSGAGRWEALVICTALTGDGTVTILDEPAVNLHPTLQRRLLRAIEEGSSQTLLVTHAPSLVPAEGQAEIDRIIRLAHADNATSVHRTKLVAMSTTREAFKDASKLQRFMMASSDVRALLFANAALLVEGDTDLGALGIWLPALASQSNLPSPDSLNLVIAAVGGDASFTVYVNYLEAFGIPWSVLCDGKVLHQDYSHSLCKQLPNLPSDGRPVDKDDLDGWLRYWESVGVFTLAESFDEEIEATLRRISDTVWAESKKRHGQSKVRAGRAFAEKTSPPGRLTEIYSAILKYLQVTGDSRS
jgi:ABC-type molybdenum transport system ATPase subunit/photorepair protein PhrA